MSKIVTSIPLPPVFYHATETSYWRRDDADRWFKVNESGAKNFVADRSYLKSPANPGTNSEVDLCLMEIQAKQNIAYVGPLAGYDAGVYRVCGNQILVTDSPQFITPKPGGWPTLDALFSGMLVDGIIDQRPYLYGWIKNAMESFRQRRWKASQLLAMAGPVGSGKSLTQNLLTVMFGGRSAKPYMFMTGNTQFNSHMFCAEHQMLEDEAESVDIRSRRHFASNIKTILTGRDQNCHGKNRVALILQPRWRMSLSLNDDPERLQVLPPLDQDVRDKIIVLKICKARMPMSTGDPELDEQFWKKLVSEIPAFLYHLDQWQIPENLRDDRYGIQAYHHPEIVEKLEQTSPELRLLELIDRALFNGIALGRPEPWEGSAAKLEAWLVRDHSPVQYEARRLLTWQNACGAYLGRLKDSDNELIKGRITKRVLHGQTIWTIRSPLHDEPVVEDPGQPPRPPEGLGQ